MDYNEWEASLFEELYPSAQLLHGEIKLSAEDLMITWGDYAKNVPIHEFYESESNNPLHDIRKWAYTSLPVINTEFDKTFVAYNSLNGSYEAYTLRPMGTYILTRNVNPHDYPNYGNYDKVEPLVSTEMEGTLICLSSKDTRLPSALAISEKNVFVSLVEKHMDYSEELCILAPEKSSHVFAGYSTAIERLQENFQTGTTLRMPSGEWFENITNDKG
ncbi:MAG: hypothetical protein H9W81_21970 [Enterococcus sp.]|nr:hypothetical protein [Enterococcus sp.]